MKSNQFLCYISSAFCQQKKTNQDIIQITKANFFLHIRFFFFSLFMFSFSLFYILYSQPIKSIFTFFLRFFLLATNLTLFFVDSRAFRAHRVCENVDDFVSFFFYIYFFAYCCLPLCHQRKIMFK